MKIVSLRTETLKEHPRNYKEHPEEQLKHIIKSIEEHGFYRNIVVANDNTILAGHGVYLASKSLGLDVIPAIKIDIEPNSSKALKILTSDNEITNLAIVDDRELSNVLKDILDEDLDLTGTGFDEAQLSALIYTTRPSNEIENLDEADEWVGILDHEQRNEVISVVIKFDNEEDREDFCEQHELTYFNNKRGKVWSTWYPVREREDIASVFIIDNDQN
jgi:hypothetical protein